MYNCKTHVPDAQRDVPSARAKLHSTWIDARHGYCIMMRRDWLLH